MGSDQSQVSGGAGPSVATEAYVPPLNYEDFVPNLAECVGKLEPYLK